MGRISLPGIATVVACDLVLAGEASTIARLVLSGWVPMSAWNVGAASGVCSIGVDTKPLATSICVKLGDMKPGREFGNRNLSCVSMGPIAGGLSGTLAGLDLLDASTRFPTEVSNTTCDESVTIGAIIGSCWFKHWTYSNGVVGLGLRGCDCCEMCSR